jgi:hypothetical protein
MARPATPMIGAATVAAASGVLVEEVAEPVLLDELPLVGAGVV